MEQQELQQKYMEYQMLDQNIKQLQQQMETADQQLMGILATLQSIDEFSSLKDGSEMLIPVNNGIFAKAKLTKEDSLLVNVGASVVVDKSIEDTKELIEKQKGEMESIRGKITENINKLVDRATVLEKELTQLMPK